MHAMPRLLTPCTSTAGYTGAASAWDRLVSIVGQIAISPTIPATMWWWCSVEQSMPWSNLIGTVMRDQLMFAVLNCEVPPHLAACPITPRGRHRSRSDAGL